MYARLHTNRRSNLQVLVDALAAKQPLRVSRTQALDTVFALTSPELNQLLVAQLGWSNERYRAWLAHALETLLLPAAKSSR